MDKPGITRQELHSVCFLKCFPGSEYSDNPDCPERQIILRHDRILRGNGPELPVIVEIHKDTSQEAAIEALLLALQTVRNAWDDITAT